MLEKAFQKASSLDEREQDEFASFILEELSSEERWNHLFTDSQDALSKLAAEAVAEYEAGETETLDIKRDFPQD